MAPDVDVPPPVEQRHDERVDHPLIDLVARRGVVADRQLLTGIDGVPHSGQVLRLVEVDPKARLQPVLPVTFLVHKPAGMDPADVQGLLDAG